MKTTTLTLIATTMVITAFNTRTASDVAADKMGLQVVSALHKSSTIHFSALYPPVEVFYELMEENTALYGSNFEEAKATFTNEYQSNVIPAMNKAFERVIAEGKKSGIDWSKIKFQRVESSAEEKEFSFAPLTIVFSANNKEYSLMIAKAVYFKGQWKVSQYLTLNQTSR
jgi:hypothetical protein